MVTTCPRQTGGRRTTDHPYFWLGTLAQYLDTFRPSTTTRTPARGSAAVVVGYAERRGDARPGTGLGRHRGPRAPARDLRRRVKHAP